MKAFAAILAAVALLLLSALVPTFGNLVAWALAVAILLVPEILFWRFVARRFRVVRR